MARKKDPNSQRSQAERLKQMKALQEQERQQLQQQLAEQRQQLEEEKRQIQSQLEAEKAVLEAALEEERKKIEEKRTEPIPPQEGEEEEELLKILNDLTEDKEPDPEPAITAPDHPQVEFAPDSEAKEEEVKAEKQGDKIAFFTSKQMAEMLISGYDIAQSFLLPLAYQRYGFAPGEFAAAKAVTQKVKSMAGRKGAEVVLDPDDLDLCDMVSQYEEWCKALPFSKLERSLISTPLEAWLEENQLMFRPITALLFVMAMVNIPRLAPIAARYNDRLNREEQKLQDLEKQQESEQKSESESPG